MLLGKTLFKEIKFYNLFVITVQCTLSFNPKKYKFFSNSVRNNYYS